MSRSSGASFSQGRLEGGILAPVLLGRLRRVRACANVRRGACQMRRSSRFAWVVGLGLCACSGGASDDAEGPASGAGGGPEQATGTFDNVDDAGTPVLVGDAAVFDDCERTLALAAVEIGDPPPFDVILVADHSQSLSWSRDELAAGLSTLLTDMRGRDARFFVLTPTQYGASSAQAIDPWTGFDLVLWKDAVSGTAFSPAMTEYTQSCFDADGAPFDCPPIDRTLPIDYSAEGAWTFVMPDAVAAISADMTDAQIEAEQQRISDAILGLQGTGSPSEQPLCTLNRYLKQAPEALPEHAVFVVISDEDDVSLPEDCAAAYHFEIATTETPFGESCTANDCDHYLYYLNEPALVEMVQYTCVPVDDLGMPHPENGVPRTNWLNGSLAADCTAPSEAGPCGSAGMDWALSDCGPGHVIEPCSMTCQEGQSSGCGLQTDDGATDYCTGEFTYMDASYASLIDYCNTTIGEHPWTDCIRQGYYAGTSRGGTDQVEPLVPGTTTQALVTSAKQLATTAFGPEGYSIELIAFDPAFACTPEQGQSFATNLKMLVESSDDVFPICGDYAPALENVRAFASTLVNTEQPVVLRPEETIDAVRVVSKSGAKRELPAARYSYDRTAGMLHLMAADLSADDVSIEVAIANPCGNHVE